MDYCWVVDVDIFDVIVIVCVFGDGFFEWI